MDRHAFHVHTVSGFAAVPTTESLPIYIRAHSDEVRHGSWYQGTKAAERKDPMFKKNHKDDLYLNRYGLQPWVCLSRVRTDIILVGAKMTLTKSNYRLFPRRSPSTASSCVFLSCCSMAGSCSLARDPGEWVRGPRAAASVPSVRGQVADTFVP